MIHDDLRWYYLCRSESALTMARRAADPATVAIHMDLYRRYLALADGRTQTSQIIPLVTPVA